MLSQAVSRARKAQALQTQRGRSENHINEDAMSSNSDTDAEDQTVLCPSTTTRQSLRQAILVNWVSSNIDAIEQRQTEEKRAPVSEEFLTMSELIASGNHKIIGDPRDYQMTLYQKAKEANIIAVLPTGSGKTLISVLLLKHILDQEIQDRADGRPPRYAFFLVNNVNLVFQQYNVLHCNLDHEILRISGADRVKNWSKETWQKHLKKSRVIVCTAAILNDALRFNFVAMKDINLLIFDETHHAKGKHPYASIMTDFYKAAPASQRPKVFGMTASPVDAKIDVQIGAENLEHIMDSTIVTTPLSEAFQNQATECVETYDPPSKTEASAVYQDIRSIFGHSCIKIMNQYFREAKDVAQELGTWSAERYWTYALNEARLKSFENDIHRHHADDVRLAFNHTADDSICTTANRKADHVGNDLQKLQAAFEYLKGLSFDPPQATLAHLSTKVKLLHEILEKHFNRPTNAKSIVFVEKRSTASLLSDVFAHSHIGGKFLKAGALVGCTDQGHTIDVNTTYKKQVITLSEFRKGRLNCLFATKVAEEGLDIPDCNLIVRFDLYDTMISYVQSKGRARKKNSKFIDMVEFGNIRHKCVRQDTRLHANQMLKWCSSEAGSRLIRETYDDDEFTNKAEDPDQPVRDTKTNAVCPPTAAIATIGHFCDMLPPLYDEEAIPPQYIVSSHPGGFLCEVLMPRQSPVSRSVGKVGRSKAAARRSAAMSMVRLLKEKEFLDEHFLPVYTRNLPELRNAHLAITSKKRNQYDRLQKPRLWTNIRGDSLPAKLHLSVVEIEGQLDRPHQTLGILTRCALPELPRFDIFLLDGPATVSLKVNHDVISTTSNELLSKLNKFLHQLLLDVYNKGYAEDIHKTPYWITPLTLNKDTGRYSLDTKAIDLVVSRPYYNWRDMSTEQYQDKFMIDIGDGGKRYFTLGVDNTKKPSDPVPLGSPDIRKAANILEYSISFYRNLKESSRKEWDWDQPVILTNRMLFRRNLLAEPKTRELKLRGVPVWVCPQYLKITAITPAFITTCLMFPAIIHRVEEYLIVLEGTQELGLGLSAGLALEALTKNTDGSNADSNVDNQDAPLVIKAGMGPNYERLEFLGDTFLKMATSISLFVNNPQDDEFTSHVSRMLMLCNRNLFENAKKLNLPRYIRSQEFSRRTWYPPNLKQESGKGHDKAEIEPTHALGEKTIADVAEALIGASLLQLHIEGGIWNEKHWDAAVYAVTLFVQNEAHAMKTWNEYREAYSLPDYQTALPSAVQIDLATTVESEHNYRFTYPRLLASAFQHPSIPRTWDKLPNYQRLEFLGDSLFDVACVLFLYHRYPDKDPSWLTEHKMAMVSNKFLGALCLRLGFHRHLRHSQAVLQASILHWEQEATRVEEEANGALDYWVNVSVPPKCLPDIVESYLGAIFIDSHFDFSVILDFFRRHVQPFFEDMSLYDRFARDHPVTSLHHALTIHLGCRDYALMSQEVPSQASSSGSARKLLVAVVMIHDKVVEWVVGESSRYAKVKVCKAVNEMIDGLAPIDFRKSFHCTCPLDDIHSSAIGVVDVGTAI